MRVVLPAFLAAAVLLRTDTDLDMAVTFRLRRCWIMKLITNK